MIKLYKIWFLDQNLDEFNEWFWMQYKKNYSIGILNWKFDNIIKSDYNYNALNYEVPWYAFVS